MDSLISRWIGGYIGVWEDEYMDRWVDGSIRSGWMGGWADDI